MAISHQQFVVTGNPALFQTKDLCLNTVLSSSRHLAPPPRTHTHARTHTHTHSFARLCCWTARSELALAIWPCHVLNTSW
eukprot:4136530-Alexandrium_andersonii.AAC.1